MKHNANILNCYVNGKKSAIICESGSMFLGSHTLAWNNTKLGNMYGWKFMYRLGDFSGVLTETAAATMLAESGPEALKNVCFEGSEAFSEIRANITRRTRRPAEPAPAPAPMPEPEPEPEPQPAPVVVVPAAPKKSGIIRHEMFDKILGLLSVGRYVYLHGPAGSGKNVIAEQCAEALGLDFYYTNTVFDKSELVGYRDAMGRYQDTQFYRAYKNGGLFMLDEADVSIPEALTTINGALAGDYYDFCGEMVKRHPDFTCIAAGNTNGQGATAEYNTRSQIDESTRNRFEFVPVDYCRAIEKTCAGGDSDILEFMRDLRKSARNANILIITGYRCMTALAKVKNISAITTAEALEFCVFKGMDKDDRKVLFNGLQNPGNVYAAAMLY